MKRRQFISASTAAVASAAICSSLPSQTSRAQTPSRAKLKIDIYGRHLLWLKTADEVAAAALETGYDGIDVNVRASGQGHVLPERVAQDLPPFVATIRKHGPEESAITPSIADTET